MLCRTSTGRRRSGRASSSSAVIGIEPAFIVVVVVVVVSVRLCLSVYMHDSPTSGPSWLLSSMATDTDAGDCRVLTVELSAPATPFRLETPPCPPALPAARAITHARAPTCSYPYSSILDHLHLIAACARTRNALGRQSVEGPGGHARRRVRLSTCIICIFISRAVVLPLLASTLAVASSSPCTCRRCIYPSRSPLVLLRDHR